MKPNGDITMKLENDEILRLQIENNKTAKEVRHIIEKSINKIRIIT